MLSNKYTLIVAMLFGGLIAGGIGFAVAYSIRSNDDAAQRSTPAVVKESTLGSKQNPHEIALSKSQTKAADLLINVGDYVQFNSKDDEEHQIIQGKPTVEHGHDALSDATHGEQHGTAAKPLDSGVIKPNEGYLLQFNNVGKYEFHDNYNHDYAITVIVYDKEKTLEDTKIE